MQPSPPSVSVGGGGMQPNPPSVSVGGGGMQPSPPSVSVGEGYAAMSTFSKCTVIVTLPPHL